MSKEKYKRVRNHTMSFRVSDEERQQLRARIAVTGLSIGEYILESALHQKIYIAVGKYQSDRLSLEIRKLREQLEKTENDSEEQKLAVGECICLIKQLLEVISTKRENQLDPKDFRTIKQPGIVAKSNKNVPAGNRDKIE